MTKKILKSAAVVAIITIIAGIFYVAAVLSGVSLNTDKLCSESNPSSFTDFNGNKMDFFASEYVTIEKIPDNLKNAFIAIEDKRFYTHGGIDIIRTIGAAAENIKTMSFKEGGSTITQQLIKNTHLGNEKTIERKIKEAKLAIELEKKYSKDEILEMYLNIIYFGSGCYGINDATHYYFGKDPVNLTLKECAVIAGIVKNPAKYSPKTNLTNSVERSNQVLSKMLENNFITEEEKQTAQNQEIIINNASINNTCNRFYIDTALKECMSILNIGKTQLLNGGYEIKTFYKDDCQKILFDSLNDEKNYSVNSYGEISDGMGIIADNDTKGITAVYSTVSVDINEFMRQPGSAVKPVAVYAPALENNLINLLTPVLDEKTTFENGYSPDNYKGKYYGWVTHSFALAKSLNIPAVKLMQELGKEKSFSFLESVGIPVSEKDGLATALGGMTYGLNIKQLCSAYQCFANKGIYTQLSCIDKIYSKNGKLLYDSSQRTRKKVMSEENAYLMTELLENVVQEGTAKKLSELDTEIAAKTGTVSASDSNYNTDAWCASYAKNITCVIWQGNADGSSEKLLPSNFGGGSYPASITKTVMENFADKNSAFDRPLGICNLKIDKKILEEYHEVMLAKENTPKEFVIEQDFNSSNIPLKVSFLNYVFENKGFTATVEKDKILLSVEKRNGKKFKLYKITRDGKEELLDEFSISVAPYSLYDDNISNNEKIVYKLESYDKIFGIEFQNEPPVFLEINLKQDIDDEKLKLETHYKYYN